MNGNIESIRYPRKIVTRSLLKFLGQVLVKTLCQIDILGQENFPKTGPLIVVGNHTAVVEAVLLIAFSPWQIEMMGAADIPHEKMNQIISDLFGFIPVNRGNIDRSALQAAISVLDQNGVIGIFPEGGIWEPGLMRAQTGVAWLSYRGNSPVLPIGFSGTLGSLGQAFKFNRPKLTMHVGSTIPKLQKQTGIPRKKLFENYSERVMTEVRKLVLPDDPSLQERIKDETFELSLTISDSSGNHPEIPAELEIDHPVALTKFLHRPAILKIFRSNLNLPTDALENLDTITDPQVIDAALYHVIHYLRQENPFLLSYRFGPKEAEEMLMGICELKEITAWASGQNYQLKLTPVRRFFSIPDGQEIVQTKQGNFKGWM
jgi:1-acyl-sn-glycerol-3-phosphate acyltransferase